jgi:hypothetical protein
LSSRAGGPDKPYTALFAAVVPPSSAPCRGEDRLDRIAGLDALPVLPRKEKIHQELIPCLQEAVFRFGIEGTRSCSLCHASGRAAGGCTLGSLWGRNTPGGIEPRKGDMTQGGSGIGNDRAAIDKQDAQMYIRIKPPPSTTCFPITYRGGSRRLAVYPPWVTRFSITFRMMSVPK